MKNIKYMLFFFIVLFFNIFHVYASCTEEELKSLKVLVEDIKITYKHKGKVETEHGVFYNIFDVKVKNIPDNFYISVNDGVEIFSPVDGEIIKNFNNGTWYFDIYSNECEEKIDTIKVFIPRFNKHSLDPLCEGIDGNDFALCGKYYEYDVDYDNFVQRVKYYRTIYNVDNKKHEEIDERSNVQLFFDNLLEYIIQYRLYILIILFVILLLLVIMIVIKKRKKRGVLE